ncbi:MAG: hypothetical protein AAF937_09090 [Planctomycetota bacterium]
MAGVPTEPGDLPAACPECGRAHAKPKHLTWTRRRWGRAVVLGLVMVVGGYGLWVVPRVQERGAWGVVPTTALIVLAPRLDHLNRATSGIYFDIDSWGENESEHEQAEVDRLTSYMRAHRQQQNRVSSGAPVTLAEELESRVGSIGPRLRGLAHGYWTWMDDMGLIVERDPDQGTAGIVREVNRWWIRRGQLSEDQLERAVKRIIVDLFQNVPIERIAWQRESLVERPPEHLRVSYLFTPFEIQLMLPDGYLVDLFYQGTDGSWDKQGHDGYGYVLPIRGSATRIAVVVQNEGRFIVAYNFDYDDFRIAADAGSFYLPTKDALGENWTGTLPNSIAELGSEAELLTLVALDSP